MTTLHPDAQALRDARNQHRTVCRWCPAVLRLDADLGRNEWRWVDEHGDRFGPDPDLPPDPYAHLNRLAARMAASRYTDMAAAAEYSSLKVRIETAGTFHQHYPKVEPPCPLPGGYVIIVPEHCAWPMWLRPAGWQCRRCGALRGGVSDGVQAEAG